MNTKTMIPQVYSKERDMQVFNRLIDIISTYCKYQTDHLGDVYDANKCPQELLPFLAYTLNYKYNFEDTVTANRRVIGAFTVMEKNRGGQTGLLMAAALSLTSLDISKNNAEIDTDQDYMDALKNLHISYDYENARIIIDYPNVYTLVRYLMDYVRPVGMYLELRSVVGHNINTDAMLIYANADTTVRQYDPEIDTMVNRNFVNFSSNADDVWLNQFRNNLVDFNNGGERS
jgi:hypothetical protein